MVTGVKRRNFRVHYSERRSDKNYKLQIGIREH